MARQAWFKRIRYDNILYADIWLSIMDTLNWELIESNIVGST